MSEGPITLNLSGVKEFGDFEPVPNGWYLVEVTDGVVREAGKEAKHPGSNYISWEFTIREEDYDGRKVWDNHTLIEGKTGKLKGMLRAADFEDLDSDDFTFDLEDVIGQEFYAKIGQEKQKQGARAGEMRNTVRAFRPLSEPPTQTVGDATSSLLPTP